MQDEIDYFGITVPTTTYTYIWGKGEHGQLGTGDRSGSNIPVIIDAFNSISITQISLGTSHTLALTNEGRLYSWGYGGDGRLGHGNTLDVLYPKLVETLINENIIEIKCGELHSAALTNEGKLYTWGLGSDGRLGHGNNLTYDKPTLVLYFCNNNGDYNYSIPIESISCGGLHCGALSKNDHKLYTWGYGNGGRLGHKDGSEQSFPKLVESLKDIDIVQVSCGGHHTAALSKDGQLYTWGFDDDGRLGHSKTGHCFEPKIVKDLQSQFVTKVSCGCWHTAALTKDGDVYCWGSCKSGQLGHGSKDSAYIPHLILQNRGVVDIACGTAHTAALTNTGQLYTWGKCDDGRLGYKTDEDQVTPRIVDAFKDCSVKQIFCGVLTTAAVVEVPQI